MAVVTEPPWVNKTSGIAARNGTTSHTISLGFTSTSGNFLVFVVFGAVTHTAGWTEQLQPVNSGELSVFTKTSAGDTSITVTHNGSNYPVPWVAYEFLAGTTWVTGTGTTPTGDTWPTLTGLPGVEVAVFAARGRTTASGFETAADTTWSAPWVEDADQFAPVVTTDGGLLSVGHQINVTATTATPTATTTYGGTWATTDREHVVFALNVASGGGTTVATKNVVTTWNVAATATKTVATTWNTAAVVTKSVATSWDVAGAATTVSKSVTTTWDTAAVATKSVSTIWDTAAAVSKTVATSWATAATVAKPAATSWNTAAVVTKAVATTWDVAAAGQVAKSVTTSWDVAAVTAKAVATTWGVSTVVAKPVATGWDTAARVAASVTTTWAVDGSPTAGIVVRPSAGLVSRPLAGVVARPDAGVVVRP